MNYLRMCRNKSAWDQFRNAQVIRIGEDMDMKRQNDEEITQEARNHRR
jgi:hypothetical protein